MLRLRELMMILIAATAICALTGCQSNRAGQPGYVPNTCAAPGSSCSGR
jgi:hypothetical protein